jgi:small-conductance mechanosensitive channel
MQLALANAADPATVVGPEWSGAALLGVAVLAIAASWASPRIGAAVAVRRWQRQVHAVAVAAWLATGWLVGLRLVAGVSASEVLTRAAVLLLAAVAALPILRDLLAGLAVVVEGRHRLGDDIRVEGHEGRIVGFGLRSAVLRDRDGTEITVPYRRLVSAAVVRLNLARRDAPCEIEVAIAPGHDLDQLSARLREAATLSPYAAPGRRPEVFVVADEQGGVRLHLLAFVFDRAHEARYRGDVLARAGLLSPPSRGS